MGKTSNLFKKIRDLFKKIRDTKATFHAKMGSIKDRKVMTSLDNILKKQRHYRSEEHTSELQS